MSLVLQRIEQAEKDAETARSEMYGETEGETGEKPEETPAAPSEAPETSPETPPEPVAAPETPPVAPVVPDKEEQTYKARYDSLQGKYNKELPNALQEAREWKDRYTRSIDEITELKSRLQALERAAQQPPAEVETDASLDELEQEFPSVAKALKEQREQHKAEMAALKKQYETGVSSEISGIKSRLAQTEEQRFDSTMQSLVGTDWRAQDKDPAFLEWLNEPASPYDDTTRLQVLQNHARNYNAPKVAKFFVDFKASSVAPAATGETGGKKLEKYVAPPSGPSGGIRSAPAGAEPSFTLGEYRDFQNDTVRGRFNPKDPRWKGKTEAQLEVIFDKLASEGKLR